METLQFKNLLREMCDKGASDLFIKAGLPPSLRIDGIIHNITEYPSVSPEQVQEIALSLMNDTQIAIFDENSEMDLAAGVTGVGRFRVNVYRQRGTIGIVARHIPKPNFDFDGLHLPGAVKMLSELHRGLILVTGTTGSGKSTTLAAMINHINSQRRCHIITVEDPIEFLHRDELAIISQREVGFDTRSFAEALKHILRQSPDVILIGEMRDQDTIHTAIAAAETGHLVMSTLHTTDAVQTVERIINYFPSFLHQQIRMELSLGLQGVISQRLLTNLSGQGRVPATEVMIVTPTIKKLLYEGKTLELRPFIADGEHIGMMTFDQSLLRLYLDKKISLDDALQNATSPDEFRLAADGISSGVKSRDFTKL
jgi:twitching motility protein PilT